MRKQKKEFPLPKGSIIVNRALCVRGAGETALKEGGRRPYFNSADGLHSLIEEVGSQEPRVQSPGQPLMPFDLDCLPVRDYNQHQALAYEASTV